MVEFAIIEVDDGLTIVELQAGELVEEAAVRNGGTLVALEPYPSYEEALDALADFEEETDEE
jgi:hypothetical protein